MKQFFLAAFFALAAAGCQQTATPSHEAERMTIQQLTITPGYDWFSYEKQAYTSDPGVVSEIARTFDTANHRVLLYVNPSCTCKGTQKLFPSFVRVLQDAGIPESKFEIYSMNAKGENHPYASKFSVTSLPYFVIMKNNQIVQQHGGELPSGVRVENFLLDQLKYN